MTQNWGVCYGSQGQKMGPPRSPILQDEQGEIIEGSLFTMID